MNYEPSVVARAELDIMGCLLVDPAETLQTIRQIVTEADFKNTAAQAVYAATMSLVDHGEAADATLILQRAAELGTSIQADYAKEAMSYYVTTANAALHADIVHNAAIQRKAASVGLSLADGELSPLEAITQLQELERGQGGYKAISPQEAAYRFLDHFSAAASGEKKPFVPTGYASLDKILGGGLVTSGLITLAARPGTGKTTIALNIAGWVAAQGQAVLYLSFEMNCEQLMARRTAAYAVLNYSQVYCGQADEQDYPKVFASAEDLSKPPFLIWEKIVSIDEIELIARCNGDLGLIVIDHIGLVKNPGGRSRYEFMTEVSHRLKQLAISTGVPILALCQLNRQSESRENKRPTVADLRDSGAIEEDSDVVALIHRPALYMNEDDAPKPWETQELEIIVGKNRHGMQGAVKLEFGGVSAIITERR